MEEHRKKAGKMAALLQAAASGKLWSKPAGADGKSNKLQLLDLENENVGGITEEPCVSTARKVVSKSTAVMIVKILLYFIRRFMRNHLIHIW